MRCKKALFALVVAVLLVSCGGSSDPVGRLTVSPSEAELGHPGLTELRFSFQFDQPLEGASGGLRVFVHLLDETGGIVRTFDHDLPVPWRPGSSHDYGVQLYQSILAPPLAPGDYELTVGLHDGAGNRWALETGGREKASGEYVVASISAVETVKDAPMFLFPDVWRPSEGGTDRQVLARRWLGGTGSLRVAGIQGEGTVWMAVGIPTADERTEELVLDEGAETPTVDVTTTCSGFTAQIAGRGSHPIEVPVEAGEEGLPAECEISFETNFYLVSLDTLSRRTVALENLSWLPR